MNQSSSYPPRRTLFLESLETRAMLAFEPVGPDFIVNDITAGFQQPFASAIDADGNFTVFWVSVPDDNSRSDILARRFDSTGTPVSSEFQINSLDNFPTGPSVVMKPDGSFIAVWQSSLTSVGPLNKPASDIYARRFTAQAEPLGPEFIVNDMAQDPTNTIGQTNSTITMAPDGSFAIVWDIPGPGIEAKFFDPEGRSIDTHFRVDTDPPSNQFGDFAPEAVFLTSDTILVLWTSTLFTGISDFVNITNAQMFTAVGGRIGEKFVFNQVFSSTVLDLSLVDVSWC